MTDYTKWETCAPGDLAAKLFPIVHTRLADCVVHADVERLQAELDVNALLVTLTGR